MSICAVIMAGGSGTRLWPLSRAAHPKQFLRLHGEGSMLQETLKRLSGLDIQSSTTICNEEHRFFVAEQLREIDKLGSIILEPVGRNTAPRYCIWLRSLSKDDPLLLVLAADHVIQDAGCFQGGCDASDCLLQKLGSSSLLGLCLALSRIQAMATLSGAMISVKVLRWTRLWRSQVRRSPRVICPQGTTTGIAVCSCSGRAAILKSWKKFRPDILEQVQGVSEWKIKTDLDFLRVHKDTFESCPAESVDYAVMEKTSRCSRCADGCWLE